MHLYMSLFTGSVFFILFNSLKDDSNDLYSELLGALSADGCRRKYYESCDFTDAEEIRNLKYCTIVTHKI